MALEIAKRQLELWLQVDERMATDGLAEYDISHSELSRSVKRVTAAEVTKKIEYWSRKVTEHSNNVPRFQRLVIRG
jgi:hypothetical protein